MFLVGEKVMHRSHGAGIITEKKKMQITETPHCYLVIQLLGSNSTLMVPTEQAEERLRPACEMAVLHRLLISELAGELQELPGEYKARQKHLEEKLKSGETKEWIGVVRDLTCRAEQNSLSAGDRKLLDRSVDLLSGELALTQGVPLEEAESRLKSLIQFRHELADGQVESADWWQSLRHRIAEPFTKSSAGNN